MTDDIAAEILKELREIKAWIKENEAKLFAYYDNEQEIIKQLKEFCERKDW
jgi:ribosome biogenesis protein Nip4